MFNHEEFEAEPWWVIENAGAGHSMNCAHAGGGDCTCGHDSSEIVVYLVTVVVNNKSVPVMMADDEEQAVRAARECANSGLRTRCRRLRGNNANDEFLGWLNEVELQAKGYC